MIFGVHMSCKLPEDEGKLATKLSLSCSAIGPLMRHDGRWGSTSCSFGDGRWSEAAWQSIQWIAPMGQSRAQNQQPPAVVIQDRAGAYQRQSSEEHGKCLTVLIGPLVAEDELHRGVPMSWQKKSMR